VQFQKWDKTQKKWRNTDPPTKHIEAIIEAGHGPVYVDVTGIITAPTMRRDGSLITEPGYDTKTKLWYRPTTVELVKLPHIGTTRPEAEAALKDLRYLIEECAFKSGRGGIDEAVALAAMMTVVLRGAFPYAPLFFFHKPESGTGGTYLTKIISNIVLGRDAVPMSVSDDPKEFKKELEAAAYEASPILPLNNLTFDLQSSQLSQIITEGGLKIRRFGKNDELMYCDCRAMTVLANGNNVHVVGDMVRRTLTARLDTGMERPETKEYERAIHSTSSEIIVANISARCLRS
jgi:putative DNA primase/helicase